MADAADFVTILLARDGRQLAKRITSLTEAGIIAHDGATWFDVLVKPVTGGLDWWVRNLPVLARQPHACIIRGEFIGTDPRCVRRRAVTRDGYPAQFAPAAHSWVALDVDSVVYLPGVGEQDVAACGGLARRALPPAFHGARALVQATSGHGIKATIRVRLIFDLSRPVSDAELKAWFDGYPVDHSLFHPVQPCYTAEPVFAPRVPNPIPDRFAELPGHEIVQVPPPEALLPPPNLPRPLPKFTSSVSATDYARREMARAFEEVSNAVVGERHLILRRVACRTARIAQMGWLPEDKWRAVLTTAVGRCAPNADPAKIASVLDWAIINMPVPGSEFDYAN